MGEAAYLKPTQKHRNLMKKGKVLTNSLRACTYSLTDKNG